MSGIRSIVQRVRFSVSYTLRGEEGRLRTVSNPQAPTITLLGIVARQKIGSKIFNEVLKNLSERMDRNVAMWDIYRARVKFLCNNKLRSQINKEEDEELIQIARKMDLPSDLLEMLGSDAISNGITPRPFDTLRILVGMHPNTPPKTLRSIVDCYLRGGIPRYLVDPLGADRRIVEAVLSQTNVPGDVRDILEKRGIKPLDVGIREITSSYNLDGLENGPNPRVNEAIISRKRALAEQIIREEDEKEEEALIEKWAGELSYLDSPTSAAQKFYEVTRTWNLPDLKRQLEEARRKHKAREIPLSSLVKTEIEVVEKLAHKVKQAIPSYDLWLNDLEAILLEKKASCFGNTQLFFLLARRVGLEVLGLEIIPSGRLVEIMQETDSSCGVETQGHCACLVSLSDSKCIIVDLSIKTPALPFSASLPFNLRGKYSKVGVLWQALNIEETLGMASLFVYAKFRLLNNEQLIAAGHMVKGAYYKVCLSKDREALRHFERAARLDPENYAAYSNQASIHASSGRYQQAMEACRNVIRINPDCGAVYFIQGYVFEQLGDRREAGNCFNTALRLDPSLKKYLK